MPMLSQLYTLGNWTVKPGSEEVFISEWSSFAAWTSRHYPAAGGAYLLQDSETPHLFVSYGSWENLEAVKEWRASPDFKAFIGKIKILCERFEPHSMKLVATSTSRIV